MGLQRFPLSNPIGGLNTRDNPSELDASEAPILQDVLLTERTIKTRDGVTQFDISGFPAAVRAEHLRPYYFSPATMRLAASIDGDIYTFTQGGAGGQRFNGTSGTVWCFESGTDGAGAERLWCLNGTDAPQKLDGTMTAAAWANSPPNGTMLRLWHNRMCIAGVAANPQRLFFSDVGNPESPAATYGTNWIDIKSTEDDLDPITWLEVLEDVLVVFKKRSVWIVFDPNNFNNRRIGSPGCENRFQSAVIGGNCFYFAHDGVYSVTSDGFPQSEMGQIRPSVISELNYAALDKVRMFASRDNRLYVAYPTSGSSNDRLLEGITGLRRREPQPEDSSFPWTIHHMAVSSACNFRPVNKDVLIGGHSGAAKLLQLFTGTNDDGAAIPAMWRTGWRGILTEEPFERLRRINILHTGKVYVEVFTDFSDAPRFGTSVQAPVPTDPLWGGAGWAGGTWGTEATTAFSRVRPESRGRFHSLQFSNGDLNSEMEIFETEIALRGGKEH